MKLFVIYFAQAHLNFRLAELRALVILENVECEYNPADLLEQSPFLVVRMKSADEAKKLLARAILINEVMELFAQDETMEGLLERARQIPREQHERFFTATFKFDVTAFGNTLTIPQQIELIERFSFLPFEGDIDLNNPAFVFSLYLDFHDFANQGLPTPEKPMRVFWGLFLTESNRLGNINQFDLKKRGYLGTTSMDAELSLIMSNVALAKKGSFILDPFVGTGSFLLTSAHFGAMTLGSDIDGRQIRGKGDGKSVDSNARDYSLTNRILGTVVCDIAHHSWRDGEWWDAIICDPPYGVRAGAKKIGVNPNAKPKTSIFNDDGSYKLPQSVPYELDEVMSDLISFAAKFLVAGGRLVYWLPTITESYSPKDVPRHKRLRLLDNCEQNFGKWARRLIVMEKLKEGEPDLDLDSLLIEIEKGIENAKLDQKDLKVQDGGLVTLIDSPAHAKFRAGYFNE